MIVIEKLQKIEKGLSTLRLIVLVLSFGLLFFTLFNSNHDIIVSLIISFIAGLLYTQKHLAPATYKLFILILMIDCIYCGGHFAQIIFSREPLTFAFVLINFYTVCVIVLFILVIWRHYQLCMGKGVITKPLNTWNSSPEEQLMRSDRLQSILLDRLLP